MDRIDEYRMTRRVLMADIRGRPRLGWMDGMTVALGCREMTVEESRQCERDRLEWRALVPM